MMFASIVCWKINRDMCFNEMSILFHVMTWCGKQQANTWTNVDEDLPRNMASQSLKLKMSLMNKDTSVLILTQEALCMLHNKPYTKFLSTLSYCHEGTTIWFAISHYTSDIYTHRPLPILKMEGSFISRRWRGYSTVPLQYKWGLTSLLKGWNKDHYCDVIMRANASQITSLTVV